MNETKNSRSLALLDKVYDELEKVDVSKLAMREIGDFLEVVQKGRFLETFGSTSPFGYGLCDSSFHASSGEPDRT